MPKGMDLSSAPFRNLFNYISANNVNKGKVFMTVPLIMAQAGQTTEAMSFVSSEDISLITVAPPLDREVKFTELSDYTVAVVTFSGFLNQETISTNRALLKNRSQAEG